MTAANAAKWSSKLLISLIGAPEGIRTLTSAAATGAGDICRVE
jgi:hypothetical protein